MRLGEPIRPTQGVDLLGFGGTSAEGLEGVFVELCAADIGAVVRLLWRTAG